MLQARRHPAEPCELQELCESQEIWTQAFGSRARISCSSYAAGVVKEIGIPQERLPRNPSRSRRISFTTHYARASVYPTAAAATLRRYESDELYAEIAARQPSSVSIAPDERHR